MIQKLPTDKNICRICKSIAKAMPAMLIRIRSINKQIGEAASLDPKSRKFYTDGLRDYINCWYGPHLQGLREAYKAILGVEYGSKQLEDVSMDAVEKYIDALHRRGISMVAFREIEPRDGKPYVRLCWIERVK